MVGTRRLNRNGSTCISKFDHNISQDLTYSCENQRGLIFILVLMLIFMHATEGLYLDRPLTQIKLKLSTASVCFVTCPQVSRKAGALTGPS